MEKILVSACLAGVRVRYEGLAALIITFLTPAKADCFFIIIFQHSSH